MVFDCRQPNNVFLNLKIHICEAETKSHFEFSHKMTSRSSVISRIA